MLWHCQIRWPCKVFPGFLRHIWIYTLYLIYRTSVRRSFNVLTWTHILDLRACTNITLLRRSWSNSPHLCTIIPSYTSFLHEFDDALVTFLDFLFHHFWSSISMHNNHLLPYFNPLTCPLSHTCFLIIYHILLLPWCCLMLYLGLGLDFEKITTSLFEKHWHYCCIYLSNARHYP